TPFHCGLLPNGIDLLWEIKDDPEHDQTATPVTYANLMVSDIASMFGLTAVARKGDCMCRFGDVCNFDLFWGKSMCTFGAGPTTVLKNCDRSTQDGAAMLRAAIGCR